MTMRRAIAAAALSLLYIPGASAHDLDRSNAILAFAPSRLEAVYTFSLGEVAAACGLDADADGVVTTDEVAGSIGAIYDCVEPYFGLALDFQRLPLERTKSAFDDRELMEMMPSGRFALDSLSHPAVVLTYRAELAGMPAELTLTARFHELFRPTHAHIVHVQTPAGGQTAAFTPEAARRRFDLGGTASMWGQFWTFTVLGVEHIFTGFDHILFLIALILLGGRFWPLVRIVSAFTAAHSISLIAAALELVLLPGRLVECGIALSIIYVAAENFFVKKADHRWILTFCFGLIHGFAFAAVLADIGLPKKGLISSLLAFNAGIEVGQIAILALILPGIYWASRRSWYRRAMYAASTVVLLFGLGWFVERLGGIRFMPF